jgi:hypothetical protein
MRILIRQELPFPVPGRSKPNGTLTCREMIRFHELRDHSVHREFTHFAADIHNADCNRTPDLVEQDRRDPVSATNCP